MCIRDSHKAGLKVIIDFVPNHVARQYGSDATPEGVTDLGEKDDMPKAFSPNNNFYYIPDTKLEGNIDLHLSLIHIYRIRMLKHSLTRLSPKD